MLKIDFSKIFQPHLDVKKSIKKKKKKQKKAVQILHLGDERRLDKLPDVVTLDFLSAYKEGLDDFLYPYVTSGYITLSHAHDYEEALITTVFGNDKHLGLFAFLQDKNVEGKPEKQLVALAEKLIIEGWHIQLEDNKYWLINGNFQRVIDLTGKTTLSKDAASMTFDPSNAHLFLEDSIAAKIQAFAAKQGYDADDLASMGHLDLLLAHTNDLEFSGYLVNYNNFRKLLHKYSKYRTLTEGTTVNNLYEQGFRLQSQLTFPIGKRTIIGNDGHEYMLTSVNSKLNTKYIVNKTLLSVVSSLVKEELFKGLRFIRPEKLTEIKELRQTFAIMRDFWGSDTAYMTYSDVSDAFHRLDVGYKDGTISKGFYKRVKEAFSAIVITEVLLLGNASFSLAAVGFDSISGNLYSYASDTYFTADIDVIYKLENAKTTTVVTDGNFFGQFLSNVFFDMDNLSFSEAFPSLCENLPQNYITSLHKIPTIDDSEYDLDLIAIKQYFDTARSLILEKVG